MAIKVGGTTVVDDSRQLTNIASVDATTVAALGSAGVGGGGGVVSLQASGGNISQGDFVALNSDGTVTSINVAGGDDFLTVSLSSGITITSYFSYIYDTFYDSANSKLIMLVRDTSNHPAIALGTVSNGNITSITTPVKLKSSHIVGFGDGGNGNIIYNSTGGFYLATFTRENDYPWHATFSVSGSTVTAHNEIEVGNYYWATTANAMSNWDSTYNRFLTVAWSSMNQQILVKHFDMTTASSGFLTTQGERNGPSGTFYYGGSGVGPAGSGVIITAYSFNAYTDLRLIAHWPNTSGSSPNQSAPTGNLNTQTAYGVQRHPEVAYNPDDDEYVVVYPLTNGLWAIPFTFDKVGGFSTNTPVQISDDYVQSDFRFDLRWNSNTQTYNLLVDGGVGSPANVVNVAFPDNRMNLYSFTASASTGSVSTLSYVQEIHPSEVTARIHYNDDMGTFFYDNNGSQITGGLGTRVPKWCGIAKENITSGSTGDIFVLSGVSPDQTGLTPRSVYYLDATTNSLTTVATDNYKIGKALTSTKLLITEGNA
jgi:hypothetical protein